MGIAMSQAPAICACDNNVAHDLTDVMAAHSFGVMGVLIVRLAAYWESSTGDDRKSNSESYPWFAASNGVHRGLS
jgi:hypothetical protein